MFTEGKRFALDRGGILIAAVFAAALGLRLIYALLMQHPGHGDPSFYFKVAENIVDGRGLVVDYIWHYMPAPETVTHWANDYWMPLTSIIIAAPLFVLGKSLWVALLPSIAAGLGVGAIAYHLGMLHTRSRTVALSAALLVLFIPRLFGYSVSPESASYYALFAAGALLCMVKAELGGMPHPLASRGDGEHPPQLRYFLAAAVLTGVAHLTRGDGVILLGVLIAVIALSQAPRLARLKCVGACLTIHAVIVAPLLIANLYQLGSLLPVGPGKTPLLRTYTDLFSYSFTPSISEYLAWGAKNILKSKLTGLLHAGRIVYDALGPIVAFGALWCLVSVLRDKSTRFHYRALLAPALFFVALLVFYPLIATVPSEGGGFERSVMAAIPFIVVLGLGWVHGRLKQRGAFPALVLLASSIAIYQTIDHANWLVASRALMASELTAVKQIVEADAQVHGDTEIVIMGRNCWQMNVSTGHKAIQIPTDNLDVIYQVAQRYGAQYLLIPPTRPALNFLMDGGHGDERFHWVADVAGFPSKVFRIELNRPLAKLNP